MLISRRDFIRQFIILTMAVLLRIFGFREEPEFKDEYPLQPVKRTAFLRPIQQPLYDTEVIQPGARVAGATFFGSEYARRYYDEYLPGESLRSDYQI